jgi:membrane protein involved in colicin uptake
MAKVKAVLGEGTRVSAGLIVHLTYDQARRRAHKITALKGAHEGSEDKKLRPYCANETLFFKAGEELSVEGELDRTLESALGIPQARAAAAAKAKAKADEKAARANNDKAEAEAAAKAKAEAEAKAEAGGEGGK